jgi:integrase
MDGSTMIKGRVAESCLVRELPLSIEDRVIKSRLGYEVELFDENGEFKSIVKLADDTSRVYRLYFDEFKTLDGELKDHLKRFYLYLIPRYLPSTLSNYTPAICFFVSAINRGLSPDMAIELTLQDEPHRNVTVMKSLVQFLVLNEFDGISFEKTEEVLRLEGYSLNKNRYLSLFTLDEELGPFTREELRVLNTALENEELHVADRLILALCIRFGLRPIQISLLKEADFVEDADFGFCYLNIPRVKQRSQNRRSEFTKRAVDDELRVLIKEVISINNASFDKFNLDDAPLFYRRHRGGDSRVRAIEVNGTKNLKLYEIENEDFFAESNKRDYAHHISPLLVFHRLKNLVGLIPLSPRTGKPFHLTPYRFRYTVGTNAVIEGMTEEEVADLLDHSSTLCVKHYFRYTREMWEMLENATSNRTEQKHFTAAWNREDDLVGNMYGIEVIELHAFTAIGKCQKEKACYLEPAVACYSCNKFCPNKEKSSHSNALTSLKERKAEISERAPASLSKQLDEAIAGCQAALAYSEGIEVVSIHQGVEDE